MRQVSGAIGKYFWKFTGKGAVVDLGRALAQTVYMKYNDTFGAVLHCIPVIRFLRNGQTKWNRVLRLQREPDAVLTPQAVQKWHSRAVITPGILAGHTDRAARNPSPLAIYKALPRDEGLKGAYIGIAAFMAELMRPAVIVTEGLRGG